MIESQRLENIRLKGIGASPGIILGKAFLVEQGKVDIPTYSLKGKNEIEKEIDTFLQAVELTRNQFLETKKEIKRKGFKKGDFIIDSYLMILEDNLLIKETINQIRKERINSAWALKNIRNNLQKIFSEIEDDYLKERRSDLDYVVERILQNLTGKEPLHPDKVPEKVIIIAHDLSPADSAHLDLEKVLGFATDVGGKTSHTAIMARALQIPAVVGLETITQQAKSGDTLIVDGVLGEVVINPSPDVFAEYQAKKEKFDAAEKELLKFRNLRAETQDGYYVRLLANIEITEELPSVIHYGAEGIGLYRTEFLYLNRSDLPSEEEQFHIYRQVVEKISPYPTTIRTFDLGGDKFISRVALAQEINPALGLRAIRLGLKEVDMFKTQIRAILRASAFGKVRILFPMVSGINEVYQIKKILSEVKKELKAKGEPYDPSIEMGIMIEIPSAVIIADLLAKEVDFFSIGTNDLIQYLLAIDRVNEHVAYLYKPLHPAVLRILKRIVEIAHTEGITVNMCGEMAGEPFYTPILLGFGIDELSMNPISILKVKKLIRSTSYRECKQLVEEALKFSVSQEVENFLRKELFSRFPEELKE